MVLSCDYLSSLLTRHLRVSGLQTTFKAGSISAFLTKVAGSSFECSAPGVVGSKPFLILLNFFNRTELFQQNFKLSKRRNSSYALIWDEKGMKIKVYDTIVRLMQFLVTFGDILVTWWHDMEHHKCSNQRDNMQAYVYMYISDENDKIKRFFVDFYRHLVFI